MYLALLTLGSTMHALLFPLSSKTTQLSLSPQDSVDTSPRLGQPIKCEEVCC